MGPIEAASMFICGAVCGVAGSLVWTYTKEIRKPLAPEFLPQDVKAPIPVMLPPIAIQPSPFAPAKVQRASLELLKKVIEKHERVERWKPDKKASEKVTRSPGRDV